MLAKVGFFVRFLNADKVGSPVDLGGYYHADEAKARAAMRPSPTFNELLTQLKQIKSPL
jgi:monomeric isocitrate dehydrogenase